MRLTFFSEHLKFHANSKNLSRLTVVVNGILDQLIRIGIGKFSLLLREYS